MLEITLEQLFAFAVAGTVVSLVFEFFPKLNTWYNGQPDNVQKLIVLGSGGLVVLGAFGLNCLDFFSGLPWVCSVASLQDGMLAYLAYIFASQGTYLVTPKK